MSRREAIALLFRAKFVLCDMGLTAAAQIAEQEEIRLLTGTPREALEQVADYLSPPGRRGRIFKVLYPPVYVRAICFVAAVLRAVED